MILRKRQNSKTSTKTKKKKRWFKDDCKTSIQKKRQALRQFKNPENFCAFCTIRDSKRKFWKKYVSKLNSRTAIKKLWGMVREAFIKKEHLVSVFSDLEKAYDTTWENLIMKDVHDIGLKGRLPLFLQDFLTAREFKV